MLWLTAKFWSVVFGFSLFAFWRVQYNEESQVERAFLKIGYYAIGIFRFGFFVAWFGSGNCFQAVWHKLFKSKTPNNVFSETPT